MNQNALPPICFLIHDLNRQGGQDRSTLEILNRLADRQTSQRQVRVICCSATSELSSGIQVWKVWPFGMRWTPIKSLWFQIVSLFLGILSRLQGYRLISTGTASWIADAIHVQFIHTAWGAHLGQLTWLRRRWHDYQVFLERWLWRPRANESRVWICLSESEKRFLVSRFHLPEDRVTVVPHGVDSERFHPATVDEKNQLRSALGLQYRTLLLVGEFSRKGLDVAIRAFAELDPKLRANWQLLAVGAGDASLYLKLARELGVQDQVRLDPPSARIQDYFLASDLFLLPTRYEPFGMVILEAWASGLPVIASRNAGAMELDPSQKCSWRIESPGEVRSVASTLQNALSQFDDPLQAKERRSASQAIAQTWTWKHVADQFGQILSADVLLAETLSAETPSRTVDWMFCTYDYLPQKGGISKSSDEIMLALRRKPEVRLHWVGREDHVASDGTRPHLSYRNRGSAWRSLGGMAIQAHRMWKAFPNAKGVALVWWPDGVALWLASLLGALGRRPHRRFEVYVHGMEFFDPATHAHLIKTAVRRILRHEVFRRATGIIAVSEFSKKILMKWHGLPSQKIISITHGVDSARFVAAAGKNWEGPLQLITVCRLVEFKRVDLIIECVAQLVKQGLDVSLRVVGEGSAKSELEKLAQDRGMADRVKFLGAVSEAELVRQYQNAHLFLLLSDERLEEPNFEGFGISILEAAACGVPAVITQSGGMPEAILPQETGWMIPTGDLSALVQRVQILYADRALLKQTGERARQHAVNDRTWSQVADRLHEWLKRREPSCAE